LSLASFGFAAGNWFRNTKTLRGKSIGINFSDNEMIFYGFGSDKRQFILTSAHDTVP